MKKICFCFIIYFTSFTVYGGPLNGVVKYSAAEVRVLLSEQEKLIALLPHSKFVRRSFTDHGFESKRKFLFYPREENVQNKGTDNERSLFTHITNDNGLELGFTEHLPAIVGQTSGRQKTGRKRFEYRLHLSASDNVNLFGYQAKILRAEPSADLSTLTVTTVQIDDLNNFSSRWKVVYKKHIFKIRKQNLRVGQAFGNMYIERPPDHRSWSLLTVSEARAFQAPEQIFSTLPVKKIHFEPSTDSFQYKSVAD